MEADGLIVCYLSYCASFVHGLFSGHFAGALAITAFKPKQLPKLREVIIPFAIGIGIVKDLIPAIANDAYLGCFFFGLVFSYQNMEKQERIW